MGLSKWFPIRAAAHAGRGLFSGGLPDHCADGFLSLAGWVPDGPASEVVPGAIALSYPEILRAVRRASARSSVNLHAELRQGLTGLATVAALAPLIGILGNVFGIVGSFRGMGTERSAAMAGICEFLSWALWPTALGLLVGLTALWGYKYLDARVTALDREMENASLELVNQLSLSRERLTAGPAVERTNEGAMFGAMSPAELRQDRRDWYISIALTGVLLVAAWSAQFAHYMWLDQASPVYAFYVDFQGYAIYWACVDVLFAFIVACIPAHAVWTGLLHRRTGRLPILASAICFCWCLAELFLRAHFL